MEPQLKEAVEARVQAEGEVSRLETLLHQLRADVEVLESQFKQTTEARTRAEENATRLQAELTEMEGEVVRTQTELTMAKAELDGAYGSRAQRAADITANPAIQREFDALNTRNLELAEELAALKAGKPGSSDMQNRVEALQKELRETVDDYEAMTKASIEFEKERERFESVIDALRDRCEQLETQLNEERISWMGSGRDGHYESTSTMVLKNEFKKMMRDTRIENMKILKSEQEERRRLETMIRNLKKEQAIMNGKPGISPSIPTQ
jgi:chromosome segregation ATPase